MKLGLLASKSAVLAMFLTACGSGVTLETRTFRLQSLDDDDARIVTEPYVFVDRPNAPGAATAIQGVLTVRETPDNLDKIARVLEEFDSPRQSLTLHFQVILANGQTTLDSSIAEVVAELQNLFRFQGYQLIAEGSIAGLERTHVEQLMYDKRLVPGQPIPSDVIYEGYRAGADIGTVSGTGDATQIEFAVNLYSISDLPLFAASVVVGVGNTVVLGTLQLPGNQALILTVRAELAG